MNKESPKADAPVPPEGTEPALLEALDRASQKPTPEEPSATDAVSLAGDLISDALDVVIAIFDN